MANGGALQPPSSDKETQISFKQPKVNNAAPSLSFSQVVKGQHNSPPPSLRNTELEADRNQIEPTLAAGLLANTAQLKTPSSYQGKPALFLNLTEKAQLVSKLNYVLVGKFSHGRPAWSGVQAFFSGLKLSGPYNLSIFDQKHLYIECSNKCDFDRLWLRLSWSIDGYIMRVFKWGPEFSSLIESPIAPVWIRMEGLPLYMFDEMPILNLANVIGRPIKIDARNSNRNMLNTARVCIELDVSKPLIDSVQVVFLEEKTGVIVDEILVKVFYDCVPPYCCSCLHIGHFHTQCKRSKDGSTKVAHQHHLGKEKVEQTDNILDTRSKQLDVEKASSSERISNQNTVKGNGKIAIWQPVVRDKKFVANIGDTGVVCLSNEGANIGVEQLKTEAAQASTSNVQNNLLRTVVSSYEIDCLDLQVVEGLGKNDSADSASKQTRIHNQFDALSPADEGNSPGVMLNKVEVDTLPQVQQHHPATDMQIVVYHSANKKVDKCSHELVHTNTNSSREMQQFSLKILGEDMIQSSRNEPELQLVGDSLAMVLTAEPLLTEELSRAKGNSAAEHQRLNSENLPAQASKQKNKHFKGQALKDTTMLPTLIMNQVPNNSGIEQELNCNEKNHGDEVNKGQIVAHLHSKSEATQYGQATTGQTNDIEEGLPRVEHTAAMRQKDVVQEELNQQQNKISPKVNVQVINQGIDSTPEQSEQEWQVVGKKKHKVPGVVTRAQARAINNTWADKVEEEQEDQYSLSTKSQAGNKEKLSRRQLERKMSKLGVRLNNMGARHGLRPQLEAEMDALQEEYSLLR